MSYLSDIASEIRAELPADLVPDDGAHDLMMLYALLVTTVGPSATRQHVHDAWVVWKAGRNGEHDAMVPYSALPSSIQLKDEPFAEAIRRVAFRRSL